MNKIPFSIYDFFGYLAPGFLFLAAIDFARGGGWLFRDNMGFALGLFWLTMAYLIGHALAQVSSTLIENLFVRKVLGAPEQILLAQQKKKFWPYLFPGFYRALPHETVARIREKAHQRTGGPLSGRALFFHCHSIVKRDQVTLERMNTFLNLYGLCRNVSLATLVAFLILLSEAHCGTVGTPDKPDIFWAYIALTLSVAMLYRYLKFYRLYTVEVFTTYAELA